MSTSIDVLGTLLRAADESDNPALSSDLDAVRLYVADLIESAKRSALARDALRDVLIRRGFVECDIAACNCGSWHHRYGLPERWSELKEELVDAGVLGNLTGNLPLNAVKLLRQQRDELLAALKGMLAITTDSQGVAGYHLNGSVAQWGEFEEVEAARAAIAKAQS